jgi:hypothetical protein
MPVQVLYKTPEGTIKDRLLGRADEANIGLATAERPWAFDGNGQARFRVLSFLISSQQNGIPVIGEGF